MDEVEWEIVRADIAAEKARLKANGDWAKWEKFQAQTNRMHTAYFDKITLPPWACGTSER